MRGHIPVLLSLEAGCDVIRSTRAYDVALLARFASLNTLKEYIDHPVHQALVAFLKPLRESTVSIDYDTPD